MLGQHERRWSAAAVAAVLTMPEDTRVSCDEWVSLLDRVDDAIRDAVYH